MFGSSRWQVSGATVLQLTAELTWLCAAAILAGYIQGSQTPNAIIPALLCAVLLVSVNGAFGLYRHNVKLRLPTYVWRLFLAMLIGAPLIYVAAEILPGGHPFQRNLFPLLVLAFCGLVLVRQVIVSPAQQMLRRHRVLVLGTGREAAAVESSFDSVAPSGRELVGFYPLAKINECAVSPKLVLDSNRSVADIARDLAIDEIIVAVRDQRGGVLPLSSLLDCRSNGVQITDLPRHYEAVEGRIRLESLKASWLIYGSGFRQGWWRSTIKRAFDIVASVILLLGTLPIIVLAAALIALEGSGPIIYRQERVGLRGRTFTLLKFRSMRADAEKDGQPRWAAAGDARVTRFGRTLRRTRIDELPQLINVLRGEMSFVGPRPERPVFVAMLTERIPFYAIRHSVKPGITGWAQVLYSYGADIEQSAKKLEYDLYYVKNHSLFLDSLVLLKTVRVVVSGEGAR